MHHQILLQISNDVVYTFLGGLILLFLIVVATYFLNTRSKRRILHGDFLKGLWRRQGHSPDGVPWAFEYFFDGEYLEIQAKPSFYGKARYKPVKQVESLIILQLTEKEGELYEHSDAMRIAIDRKAKQIYINQLAFKKVSSSIIETTESPAQDLI